MAITGSFHDIPLQEILSTVRKRSGKLMIIDHDLDQYYELHLREGVLCKFMVNSYSILDVSRIRDYIRNLMRRTESTFEFHRTDPSKLDDEVELALGNLSLVMSSGNLNELIEQNKERLPHPDTRFKVVEGFDFLAGEGLEIFYQSARVLLMSPQGTSAREILQRLDLPMSMDVARYYIYQLRIAGAIETIKAFEDDLPKISSNFDSLTPMQRANLAQRQKEQQAENDRKKAAGGGIIARLLNALKRTASHSRARSS